MNYVVKKLTILLAACSLEFAFSVAVASESGSLSPLFVSGRFAESNGAPVVGPVNISVSFFGAKSSGEPLGPGAITKKDVPLTNGVFSVALDLSSSEYHAIFADASAPTWVEITDLTHGRTYPRQQYSLVPYAMKIQIDDHTLVYNPDGNLTLAPTAISDAIVANDANISQSKISGLSSALASKSDSSHSHSLSGDVTGTLDATVVSRIQGMPISTTPPTVAGQVLKWDGSKWSPGVDLTGSGGTGSITALLPLSYETSTTTISMTKADAVTDGYLSASDWSIFSSKQDGLNANSTLSVGQIKTNMQNGIEITPYATGSGQTGELRFNALAGTNYIGLKAPDSITSSQTYTLPSADGAPNQVLQTDGSGTLGWATLPSVPVLSVAGKTGAVVLTTSDVQESTNLYFTDTRARASLSATDPLLYDPLTGVLSLPKASGTKDGYLSSADWISFNNKQNAISYTPLNKAGDTLAGNLDAGQNKISALAPPVDDLDAANKAYVDAGDMLLQNSMLKRDGSVPLTASWNIGGQDLTNVGNLSLAAAKTLGLGVYSADPTGLTIIDTGKIWFNSASGQIKYWDGLVTKTVAESLGPTANLTVGTVTTNLQAGVEIKAYGTNPGETGELRFAAPLSNNYVGFKAPDSISTSRVFTLPATLGSTGQVLQTDGSGALSWITPPPVAVSSVNGATGSVNLTSDNITEGSTNLYFTTSRARYAFSASSPLNYNSTAGEFSLPAASNTANGYLSSTDWIRFNDKQPALGYSPVNKAGDTLVGDLNMGGYGVKNLGLPSSSNDAATKGYIDNEIANRLKRDGSSPLTGPWNVGGHDLTNVGNFIMGSAKTLGFGVYSSAQEGAFVGGLTLFDAGKAWYNSTIGQLKYWDGISVKVLRAAGGGIDTLNGLSASAQSLAVGSAGTTPAFSSSGDTHTLNLPRASTSGVTAGLISNDEWNLLNSKQSAITASSVLSVGTVTSSKQIGFEMKPWGVSPGQTGELRFGALVGTNYVGFKAPDIIDSTRIWTLPTSDGSNGQVLTTNGSGSLSWTSAASPPVTSVAGRTGAVTLTTDDTTEGVSNLYFTPARARAAISASAPLAYNNTTGYLSLNGPVPVSLGGTGATALTGILIGNGTSPVSSLTASAGLQYLRSNTVNTGFEFAALPDMAMQNANSVSITGGSISGVTFASKGITDQATSTSLNISGDGSVGVGSASPTATLDVNGTMRLNSGTQANGKVLVSDATGNAGWQNPAYYNQMCPSGKYLQGFDANGDKICNALVPSFTDVQTGNHHICGLLSDGTVDCWGYDGNGELGDNLNVNSHRYLPAPVYLFNGSGKLTGATALGVGGNHSCAVVSPGSVYCWGNNSQYQLGDGTTATRNGAVRVAGITNAVSLALGNLHTCARLADGTVKCWGYGPDGELGNNAFATSSTPVTVKVASGSDLTGVTQIASGSYQSCALKSDNTLWCWGYNNYGQLGTNDATARRYAVQVTTSNFGTNVAQVSMGGNVNGADYTHVCAIKTDGTVWCWGYGGNGELGNNATGTSYVPVQALDSTLSPLTGATGLGLGGLSSCAILSGGALWCWGYNYNGQLGDNTTNQRQTASRVLGVGGTGYLTGVVKVTLSKYHTAGTAAAILNNDQLMAWGYNGYGTVGDNTTNQRYAPVFVHYP